MPTLSAGKQSQALIKQARKDGPAHQNGPEFHALQCRIDACPQRTAGAAELMPPSLLLRLLLPDELVQAVHAVPQLKQ